MNISDFIHPDDAAALNALQSIPVFPSLVEKALQYGLEDIAWSENVTTNLRLSPEQMPEIYNRLPPICEALGIPVPELYLQMSPVANAWTSGNKRVYIVVTLGLIKRFKDEELDVVLAHECGHILCKHVLYNMLAQYMTLIGEGVLEGFFGSIGSAAMTPVKQALTAWSRASELSADRVACLFASAETLAIVMAKLDGMPKSVIDELNLEAWMKQGKDYEDLKKGNAWSKIVRFMANSGMNHPYGPVRAYEASVWENSRRYAQLKNDIKLLTDAVHCPVCGEIVSADWAFCKHCGSKIK